MDVIRGTIRAEAMRRRLEHAYLVPERSELTLRSLYPERVFPYREWPQDVLPPQPEPVRTVTLVDYEVRISAPDSQECCSVEVWAVPNKCDMWNMPRRMATATARYPVPMGVVDAITRRAFRGHEAG